MVDTGCVACQNTWEQDYTSKITQTPTVVGGDAKVCLSCPGSCDIAVSTGEPPDEVIEGRFRFGMGEWTESSEDNSSTESEAPAPRKKMKLSVRKEKDKENRWQFVDETKEQALGTKFVPKNTQQKQKDCFNPSIGLPQLQLYYQTM